MKMDRIPKLATYEKQLIEFAKIKDKYPNKLNDLVKGNIEAKEEELIICKSSLRGKLTLMSLQFIIPSPRSGMYSVQSYFGFSLSPEGLTQSDPL